MLRIASLCALLSFCGGVHAESDAYNRVDFQVESSREVANDLLIASMNVEIQDRQPARVAQQLNATINDALKRSATFDSIKVSSGNQNTYPVYDKNNHVDSWRGHAEIRLESRDFKAAGELIMLLQQSMQLDSIQFSIAPDTRAKTEKELIAEALKTFQNRAEGIRSVMGASTYKNVRLSINNGGGLPMLTPKAMMRTAMAIDAAAPAPEFAAGDSRMTVQINGLIELR